MKDRNAFYTLAGIILIFGLFLIIPNPVVGPATDTSQAGVITYQGVEEKTALELLEENHEVELTSYDFGDFVTAIDGMEADSTTHFWAFYVNGEQSGVGASNYVTKPGDKIEWRLEAIEP